MMKLQPAYPLLPACHEHHIKHVHIYPDVSLKHVPLQYDNVHHGVIPLSKIAPCLCLMILRLFLRGMVLCLPWLLSPNVSVAQKPSSWHISGRATGLFALVSEDFSPKKTNLQRLNLQLNAAWHGNGRLSGFAALHNHVYTGKWLSDYPGYSFLSFNRFDRFDLTNTWYDDTRAMAFSRLDRAWIEYAGNGYDIRVGRQLIGWGQTLIWNISDIFNTYSLLEIDRMPRQGTDAVRVSIYPSPASVFEVAATLNAYNEPTAAAMFRHSFRGIDLQWQTGLVENRHWMAGGGFSTHMGITGVRGEYGLFVPLKSHPTKKNILMVVLGADHIFRNKLIVQGEVLYNQMHFEETAGPLTRLYRSHSAPYMLSLSTWSMSLNVIYPVRDRLRMVLMTAAFTDDMLLIISPSLHWQWTQNTEISAEGHAITLEYQKNRQQIKAAMLRITHRF
jgi:hypothetical protein